MVQRLEANIRKSLNNINVLYHKIQVNVDAHCPTHCDYEIITKNKIILIEAKECKVNLNGYGTFAFDRLTQKNALVKYNSFSEIVDAYVCISFRTRYMKNSPTYMIPINKWVNETNDTTKKSFNMKDMEERFSEHKLTVKKGSTYDLTFLQ